tara:strand:- start:266 stop:670 length:405 start_codon:yes stop_codon:yes gene_type:complete
MNSINKEGKIYKSIGEVAKELDLIDKDTGKLQTHTIRYWETQFKQIRPTIMAGRRRYYSIKNIKILNYIKSLLKVEGFTINGVKKILESKKLESIDDRANIGVYKPVNKSKKIIKDKIKNISKIIKEMKKIRDG